MSNMRHTPSRRATTLTHTHAFRTPNTQTLCAVLAHVLPPSKHTSHRRVCALLVHAQVREREGRWWWGGGYMFTCMYAGGHASLCFRARTRSHIHACDSTHAQTRTLIRSYARMHACMHTHTHTHTHTHKRRMHAYTRVRALALSLKHTHTHQISGVHRSGGRSSQRASTAHNALPACASPLDHRCPQPPPRPSAQSGVCACVAMRVCVCCMHLHLICIYSHTSISVSICETFRLGVSGL